MSKTKSSFRPSTGKYWDFWGIQKTGNKVFNSAGQYVDEWRIQWGGKIDNIATNPGYFPRTAWGAFGTQATSLAFLAGIITIAEQRVGVINHALHLLLPETRGGGWTWPAQRTDGYIADTNAIPQGTAFRLPANLNLDAIDMDAYARMLAKAVQKYGMYVSDTAGVVAFRAENPGTRYAVDPYTSPGGIFHCPSNFDPNDYSDVCWPVGLAHTGDTGWGANGRLRGFPWDKLQALQTNFIPWDQAPIN
jgi:hypothetical protein